MIGSFRLWRSLLGVSALVLLSGCGWFGGGSNVTTNKARPGADRDVVGVGALPSANPGRQYEPGYAATDETRLPRVGSIVAGQGRPEGPEGSGRQGGRGARRQGSRGAREARGRRPRGEGEEKEKEKETPAAARPVSSGVPGMPAAAERGNADSSKVKPAATTPAAPEPATTAPATHRAGDGCACDDGAAARACHFDSRAAPSRGRAARAGDSGAIAHVAAVAFGRSRRRLGVAVTLGAARRRHASRRHGRCAGKLHAGERGARKHCTCRVGAAAARPGCHACSGSSACRGLATAASRRAGAPRRSEQGLRSAGRLDTAGPGSGARTRASNTSADATTRAERGNGAACCACCRAAASRRSEQGLRSAAQLGATGSGSGDPATDTGSDAAARAESGDGAACCACCRAAASRRSEQGLRSAAQLGATGSGSGDPATDATATVRAEFRRWRRRLSPRRRSRAIPTRPSFRRQGGCRRARLRRQPLRPVR